MVPGTTPYWQAAEAVQEARAHGIPLVIKDRVDVALAVDADGIHVGQFDRDPPSHACLLTAFPLPSRLPFPLPTCPPLLPLPHQAAEAVAVARAHGIPLVINDRVDVALAVDADGIHVGQSDMDAATVRQILGPTRIIGVSCKSREHAEKAWRDGADYIGVGGVFPTNTKANNKTIGVEGLADVCLVSKLPVVAIGGIKGGNISDVVKGVANAVASGAGDSDRSAPAGESSGEFRDMWEGSACGALGGVAVVSAIFDQANIVAATQGLVKALDAAEEGTPLCK
ncbi:unnamed protein product [Closterium sp. NIES-65]|nr:unnamed protein product [Closterium sp. NIES-65]